MSWRRRPRRRECTGGPHSAPCGPAGSLRSGNPTPAARANLLRPPRMCNGRDALPRVRCPYAVFGRAGSSTLPLQCAAVGDNRPPANESIPKWANAIVNRKFPSPRRRGRRRYGDKATIYQLPTTSSTLPHGHFPRRRGRTPLATACAAHFVRGICRYGDKATIYQLPSTNYKLTEAQYPSSSNRTDTLW